MANGHDMHTYVRKLRQKLTIDTHQKLKIIFKEELQELEK
jgi:hypothetical protein